MSKILMETLPWSTANFASFTVFSHMQNGLIKNIILLVHFEIVILYAIIFLYNYKLIFY